MAELDAAKRTRSTLQGHLTRYLNRFNLKMATMDHLALNSMLHSIEELERKFLAAEEKVVQLEEFQGGVIPEEIEPSAAFNKFMDDLEDLQSKLQTLIEERKPSSVHNNSSFVKNRPFRLPKLEIPTFSGEFTKWFDFKSEFQSLVSDTDLTDIDRFRFLKSALTDEPKRIINSMEVTEANYKKAWDALVERYDDTSMVFRAHINSILSLQGVSGANVPVERHRKLLDDARSHFRALMSLGTVKDIADNFMICIMLRKLDYAAQEKWEDYSDEEIASWDQFTAFYEKYASTMEKVNQTKAQSKPQPEDKGKKLHATLKVSTKPCLSCLSPTHELKECPNFLKLTPTERLNETKRLKACMKCLTDSHNFRKCRARCGKCQQGHNFLLHDDSRSNSIPNSSHGASGSSQTPPNQTIRSSPQATSTPTSNRGPTSHQTMFASHDLSDYALIGSAFVNVFDDNEISIPVRALLDSGSTTNLVSDRLARLINANVVKGHSKIGGVGNSITGTTGSCCIRIGSRFSDKTFIIHASTLPKVSDTYPPVQINIRTWNIPSDLQLADPAFNRPQRIDLLIGAGLFWHLLHPERIALGPELPFLQSTDLGYIVVGPIGPNQAPLQRTLKASHKLQSSEDESLADLVQRFWELDTFPGEFNIRLSPDDQCCEDIFSSTTRRDPSGRYIVQLPFRPEAPPLGKSANIARQRFLNLERKLSRDPELKRMYSEFIDEYEKLGHLERVEVMNYDEPHYFIPHHCVLKPTSSTTKLRVVFDASCKTSNGLSLNDNLLAGPKIQEDLMIILLRFRLFKFVATADVKKMYRQFLIDPSHARYQLIYWRKNESSPLDVFRLLTVTYGTRPGAYLAIRALHQLARDEGKDFPLGAKLLLNNFYVDDALMGADTLDELQESLDQLSGILQRGGLALGKYCSNSPSVMQRIPPENHEKCLRIDDHEIIRTLGLLFEPTTDTFHYCTEDIQSCGDTKRRILSLIAKMFDPLGLISPVVTLAKIFYQDLWKLKLDWDEVLPEELSRKWHEFCQQLSHLKELSIPRYLLHQPKPRLIELHGFADASERAYGACIYLTAFHEDGSFTAELIAAKSRVAPTKTLSIARLELCAAKLLVDLTSRLKNKVFSDVKIARTYYWTDSSIALCWIKSEPHRWATFVAHRVTKIQELSSILDWHHISGTDNPADLLSRGCTPLELARSTIWWHGPQFLTVSECDWPREFDLKTALQDAEEARAMNTVLLSNSMRDFRDITRSMHFSAGFRGTRRAFAYALRFIKNAREKAIPEDARRLQLNDLDYARIPIPSIQDEIDSEKPFLQSIQRAEFPHEYAALERDRPVHGSTPLRTLAPFMEDGILRVGGRILNARVPPDAKHQILLPKDHPYTNQIVFFFHHYRVFHAGAQTTLTAIRTRYWPIAGTTLTRKVVFDCVWCFRLRPRFLSQLMADLPVDRVNPRELRAFNISGVDFAGPFVVRHHMRCKQEKKVYLALFICFLSKAVHVELVTDLSTQAFLRAMGRFVSDRGNVAKMYSDNATNFVGAANVLREAFKMLEDGRAEVEKACRKLHIEWSFIPPRTPHHGGLWEASIKLLKRIVVNIAGNLNLTEDELRTVAKQAQAIINSRPISAVSSDPNDLEPLTPGHFVYGGPASALPQPPINIPNDNLDRVQVARRMIGANQQIWKRFHTDYLSLLQARTKWHLQTDKFSVGSLVLLKEDNTASLHWPIGRIVATYPSSNNVVRVIDVKTVKGIVKRGISGVALLPDNCQPTSHHGREDV